MILIVDSLIEELKVKLEYAQATLTWEGFPDPTVNIISTWV